MTNSASNSAIVTGASGGIGGSIAKRLAKDGFSVVVNYAGKPAPAQAFVADIKAAGGQGIAVQADVAIAADVERLFKESMDAFGRPDVVVHCAGIMPLFPIASGDIAAFDKVIATTCAEPSWYSRRRLNMFSMAAASWLSPAVFSPSPSRLTVPTSLPRRRSRAWFTCWRTNSADAISASMPSRPAQLQPNSF
jgi:NAD(P)-dependent dehydrogenase (short-subunit alcohol dehydrogenase family)